MKNNGICAMVWIDADIYPNPNGILAMNFAPKYSGKRRGWYGAKEVCFDQTHREYVFKVYDFDYYVNHII